MLNGNQAMYSLMTRKVTTIFGYLSLFYVSNILFKLRVMNAVT